MDLLLFYDMKNEFEVKDLSSVLSIVTISICLVFLFFHKKIEIEIVLK